MKKIVLSLSVLFFATVSVFAQSDLQPLAVVKLNKSESITVKQLKARVGTYEKQVGRKLTASERKEVLTTLIEEKLVIQAAQKAGIAILDSHVDQYFAQGMSQSIGQQVTEKELADVIKKSQGISLDEFLIKQVGMNVSEYKAFLKNQLMMQQYVVSQKQAEIQKVAPSDEQIRLFYESNKSSFVWNDMIKALLVIVPKGQNVEEAKQKLVSLKSSFKDKKVTAEQMALQSQQPNSGYQAGVAIIPKNEQSAVGIGMSFQNLNVVFAQEEGFISDVEETDADYRFISLIKKYNAKILSISDIVQPDTTVTVYDYIRSNLTQQLQMQYVGTAAQEISKSLNVPENVEMKKSGEALDKLLNWGE